jgi:hypothetical protein
MGDSEARDKEYEKTVLNFLDRELSDLQLQKKPEAQSTELDSLVNSLLEQVITESDLNGGSPGQSEALKAMLAEFPTEPKSEPENSATEAESVLPEIHSGDAESLFKTTASLRTNRGRLPLVIIALVCALGLIGAIVYYLSISQ